MKFIKNKNNLRVGILGLSYKPFTDVIEESPGIKLAKRLNSKKYKLIIYDPQALANSRLILKKEVIYAKTSHECIKRSDVVIVTTPWPEFRNIPNSIWSRKSKTRIVIDCWRILKFKNLSGIKHVKLGIGSDH